MEIISIDVHAKKDSLVFDGEQIRNYNVADLRSYVKSIKAGKEQVIIIVNAPLTGYVEEFDKVTVFSPTVIRGIEYFFSQKEFGYSMTRVPGVHITAYSSLAYWTIVQNVFNLNLARGTHATKFVPVFGKEQVSHTHVNLVETHSNVALWLLADEKASWNLADKRTDFKKFRDAFCDAQPIPVPAKSFAHMRAARNAHEFDCIFSYLLIYLWHTKGLDFAILGNKYTGGLLLPFDDSLLASFRRFAQRTYRGQLQPIAKTLSKKERAALNARLYDLGRELEKKSLHAGSKDPEACTATNHAFSRAKERLGLNKSGLNNLMHKAEREGRDRSMVRGGLRNYMNDLWAKNQTADNIKVYGENIFVFDGRVLITLYPVPKKFRKHLGL